LSYSIVIYTKGKADETPTILFQTKYCSVVLLRTHYFCRVVVVSNLTKLPTTSRLVSRSRSFHFFVWGASLLFRQALIECIDTTDCALQYK